MVSVSIASGSLVGRLFRGTSKEQGPGLQTEGGDGNAFGFWGLGVGFWGRDEIRQAVARGLGECLCCCSSLAPDIFTPCTLSPKHNCLGSCEKPPASGKKCFLKQF